MLGGKPARIKLPWRYVAGSDIPIQHPVFEIRLDGRISLVSVNVVKFAPVVLQIV